MNATKPNAQDRILAAAETLMLQEGFHAVSVDRIIATAGVSKGSFFYHFPTKDALPKALLERFLAQQGEAMTVLIQQCCDRDENPLVRAQTVIRGLAPLFTHALQGAPGCVMAAFSYQLTADCPNLTPISQGAVAGWREHFGALLAPITQGRPDQPSGQDLAEHLLCCLQGASILARIKRDPAPLAQAAEQFNHYLSCLFALTSESAASAYTCATSQPR